MIPPRLKYWLRAIDPDAKLFWLGYAFLLPFYLAPLLVTRLLPGLDLPFHLSIADMLRKGEGSPYAPHYEGGIKMAPYAAHYLALWLLGAVMPMLTAHKLVVAAYVAAMPASAAALLGACGRSRVPALLAFPVAYNLTLHYGFVSFALSLPALLLFLARLSRMLGETGECRRAAWRSWAWTAAFCFALFLWHLQSFLYGVCAAGAFVLFAGVPWRRRVFAASSVLPALAALAWWQVSASFDDDPLQQKKSLAFAWAALRAARLADLSGSRTVLADLQNRLIALPSHGLRGFTDLVDERACRVLLALLLAYLLLGIWGRFRNGATVGERLRLAGVVAFAGALLAYLALPHHLQAFELMTFYPRFAPLLLLMTLLLVPGGLKGLARGRLRFLVPLPALLLGALYGRELIRHYAAYADETRDFVAVLDRTPPGGKALGLVFDRQSRVMRIESAMLGLPNFYPAVARARGSMIPLTYCGMRHIPCRRRQPLSALPDPGPWEPNKLRPELAVPFFDYFFVRSGPPAEALFGSRAGAVTLLAEEGLWAVYARKGAGAPVANTPPVTGPRR